MKTSGIKILEAEQEFNSDFRSIVQTFIDADHSLSDTATLLGFGRHAFKDLMKTIGYDSKFIKGHNSAANKSAVRRRTPKTKEAVQKALEARFKIHAFEYNGITDTATGHARRYGLTPRAVRYRKENGLRLEDPLGGNRNDLQ